MLVRGLVALAGLGVVHLAGQEPTFRADVSNLRIEVSVASNNQPIQGLRSTDFVVRDEGKSCPVVSFAAENLPLDLVLLLDVSGTMYWELRRLERDALRAIQQTQPGDKIAIMSFAVDPRLDLPFTSDRAALEKTIKQLSRGPREGNPTYHARAILAAGRLLAQVGEELGSESPRRKAILIVTDNLLEVPVPDQEIVSGLSAVDMLFSAIVVPAGGWRTPPSPRDDPKHRYYTLTNVFHIAKLMGGDAFLSKGTTIPEMLARLRQRYTIWCKPAGAPPGAFRKISVDLAEDARRRYPKAEIHAPEGYFARSSIQ